MAGSANERAWGWAAVMGGGGILLAALVLVPFVLLAGSLGGIGGFSDDAAGSTGGTISCANSNFEVKESGDVVYEENPPAQKKYKAGSPKDFTPLYQAAAAHYKLGDEGPNYLSAIHKIETAYSSNLAVSTAEAKGPMQFIDSTWAAYAVDANDDGKRNVWDPEDNIFGAANYLSASGAPGDWGGALYAYNHAGWYVAEVTADAQSFNIEPC